MSLGFNTNRPQRTQINQMLGSISNVSYTLPMSSKPTHKTSAPNARRNPINDNEVLSMKKLDQVTKADIRTEQQTKPEVNASTSATVDNNTAQFEALHYVYGTASTNIYDLSNTLVASKDDVLKLVYPMKKENDSTLMRAYLVDKVTAQISYKWVVVFEMVNGKPVRNVVNFSPLPPTTC